jgi:NADPH:quinone reductase-like Zn-dependent oxidoreductase
VHLGDFREPVAGPAEVLVRVQAAGVNPFDWRVRNGELPWLMPRRLPKVLGCELSGEVVALGPGAERFAVGDAVFGRIDRGRMGAFAELAAVAEKDLALKPASLSHVQAASLPLTALAAWQALMEVADLQPEQKLLVHGGAGGVGSMAIQLARHRGAWISATCSDRNLYYVLDLGVIRSIDYSRSAFETRAPERDVILDIVGGDNTARSIRSTKRGGTVVSLAGVADPALLARAGVPALDVLGARWTTWGLRRLAKRRGVRWVWLQSRADGEQLAHIAELVVAGHLVPQIARIFPFKEVREALFLSSGGRMRGKYVVAVDPQAAVGQSPSENVLKDSRSLFSSGAKRA